jgi:hypothetical protein
MEVELKDQTVDQEEALELGILLGQRRTFGVVAGRCSAAQAETLRKLHDEKKYLKYCQNWDEFCARRLKIPRRTADRILALLKKYGLPYFVVSALTGLSPAEYERIEPCIQPDGLHSGGEVIALIPENTERLVEAVAKRQAEADTQTAAEPAVGFEQHLRELEKRAHKVAQAYRKLSKDANQFERSWLNGSVRKVSNDFKRIEIEG